MLRMKVALLLALTVFGAAACSPKTGGGGSANLKDDMDLGNAASKVTVVEKVALAPTLEGGSVVNTKLAVTVVLGLEVALAMFAVVVEALME